MTYDIIDARSLKKLREQVQKQIDKGWKRMETPIGHTFDGDKNDIWFCEMILKEQNDNPGNIENITGNAENRAAMQPKPSDYFYNTRGD